MKFVDDDDDDDDKMKESSAHILYHMEVLSSSFSEKKDSLWGMSPST